MNQRGRYRKGAAPFLYLATSEWLGTGTVHEIALVKTLTRTN